MPTLKLVVLSLTVFLLVAAAPSAHSAVVHDEAIDGDLSTSEAAPTSLVFANGSNIVTGTIITPADTRDYITFTVPPDTELTALRQLVYESLPGMTPGNRGFHAINTGATSFIPSAGTAGSFLGGAHHDPLPVGTDTLPILAGAPQAGTGFTVPLGPGTYSYVIQQTSFLLTGYSLEFELTPIPTVPALDPAGLALLTFLLVAALVLTTRRLRARTRLG